MDRVIDGFKRSRKKHWMAMLEAEYGLGFLDRGVKNLLDELNAIQGVCTFSSCRGHSKKSDLDQLGYIAIWTSLAQMTRLQQKMIELLSIDRSIRIELVRDGGFKLVIRFKSGLFNCTCSVLKEILL